MCVELTQKVRHDMSSTFYLQSNIYEYVDRKIYRQIDKKIERYIVKRYCRWKDIVRYIQKDRQSLYINQLKQKS